MPLTPAPFHADLAEGPHGSRAWWVRASDGLRIRVAHYPATEARGTVLLFPGRTEYAEKYGRTAADLAACGWHVLAVDWRGQGLADRMLEDRRTGHVVRFADYQHDVAAVLATVQALDLPQPLHLIAHSMGGCIGLRALIEGLPMVSAVFTGPMWGIRIASPVRPAAWALSWSSKRMGLGHLLAPGTGPDSYVISGAFDDNTLTTDPEMWDYMRRQILARPELQLGGPSMHWLHEALAECRWLARHGSPAVPAMTFLGSNERIVDTDRIHDRMARWAGGRLVMVDRGEHEILMERADIRQTVTADISDFFARAEGSVALTA